MSTDGDTVREALTFLGGEKANDALAALAALARLEAVETSIWHLQGAWDQERAQIVAQRDALAETLREIAAFPLGDGRAQSRARAALAEAGLE